MNEKRRANHRTFCNPSTIKVDVADHIPGKFAVDTAGRSSCDGRFALERFETKLVEDMTVKKLEQLSREI